MRAQDQVRGWPADDYPTLFKGRTKLADVEPLLATPVREEALRDKEPVILDLVPSVDRTHWALDESLLPVNDQGERPNKADEVIELRRVSFRG